MSELTLTKTFPCDATLRLRCLQLLEGGLTQMELSRRSGVDASIINRYLSAAGNIYEGDIAPRERRLASYLQRHDLETLAGIPTIKSAVCDKVFSAARMVRRCHIMGKGIGRAGIGKTRAATLLAQEDGALLIFASQQEGTKDSIRSRLFKQAGIRGPQKKNRKGRWRDLMYADLVTKLRGTEMLIVIDQAHMLTAPAINFLVELWDATASPQLWLGTDALLEKLDRDEQWASRLDFTFPIEVQSDEVRPLVQHQIKSRIADLNGESLRLTNLCEKLALKGSFRRVEMRLATMLYLRESSRNKDRSWCELFEESAEFLSASERDEI